MPKSLEIWSMCYSFADRQFPYLRNDLSSHPGRADPANSKIWDSFRWPPAVPGFDLSAARRSLCSPDSQETKPRAALPWAYFLFLLIKVRKHLVT